MKTHSKLLILSILILLSNTIKAQFIVYEEDEGPTPYNDYQVFETNSLDLTDPNTTFDYRIKNTGTTTIDMRILVESVENSNNGAAEFCYNGLCTYPVLEGNLYPVQGDHIYIQPGQLQPDADTSKFAIMLAGEDPDLPVVYTFKFYQVDANENEIGTPLHIICKYVPPTAGVEQFSQNKPLLYPNPAQNTFKVNKAEYVTITNILGKFIKRVEVSDNKPVDVSSFKRGVYFVSIFDKKGFVSTEKLIIN